MIQIITGHLGSGRWRLKEIDGIPFLSHIQIFSRRGEFRIGPDQIISVTKIRDEQNQLLVEIKLSDSRHCQALISPEEFDPLLAMIARTESAPLAENQTQSWINILLAFVAIIIILEIIK